MTLLVVLSGSFQASQASCIPPCYRLFYPPNVSFKIQEMDVSCHVIIALLGFSSESFQCPAQAVNK